MNPQFSMDQEAFADFSSEVERRAFRFLALRMGGWITGPVEGDEKAALDAMRAERLRRAGGWHI